MSDFVMDSFWLFSIVIIVYVYDYIVSVFCFSYVKWLVDNFM